jgi:hypothetical protein
VRSTSRTSVTGAVRNEVQGGACVVGSKIELGQIAKGIFSAPARMIVRAKESSNVVRTALRHRRTPQAAGFEVRRQTNWSRHTPAAAQITQCRCSGQTRGPYFLSLRSCKDALQRCAPDRVRVTRRGPSELNQRDFVPCSLHLRLTTGGRESCGRIYHWKNGNTLPGGRCCRFS